MPFTGSKKRETTVDMVANFKILPDFLAVARN